MYSQKVGARRAVLWAAGVTAAMLVAAVVPTFLDAARRRVAEAATIRGDESRTYAILARTRNGRFEFEPPALWVEPGERVVWLNVNDFHSSTAYHPDNGKARRIPEKASAWDSGIFGLDVRAVSFSYRFVEPGVYDYFCRPHELLGMQGRVVVGAGATSPEPVPGDLPPVEQVTGAARQAYRWEARLNVALWQMIEASAGEAAGTAERLVSDFRTADDGARELRQRLRAGRAIRQFEQGLNDLASAVRAGDFEAALAASDRVRDQLAALR